MMLMRDIKMEEIMIQQCKTCKKYKGDCGNHFKDEFNHIHFDIPSEGACDRYGWCTFYEEIRSEYQIALEQLEKYERMIDEYIDTKVLRKSLENSINELKRP